MNKTPLMSIALCTYNGQRYLKEQLNSVINQTYKNIEIVIVDDCSSDLTHDIIRDYAETHASVKVYVNPERLGYNKNFEKALKLCTGEFIAICDQDDIWRHDKLEIQQCAMKHHMLVYCDSHFIDGTGKSMNYKMSDKFNFYKGS
ncbi:glycosyltransferase [Dyadobacter sp. CY326]|uniref:glycosyltransferase n=1 Tax=Dyadobacter sp. CY326 TaxID=2907300 RepID=UPI001F3F14D2|nr:glycosyltransferase [Dyadobacter sp. CY326]MCE7064776.1 glycosyltransferase [Dyadobacter sp. CY326]